ncbi:hypothetical protein BROUX41_004413 [Berkeleyomyces rouxiae]
MLAEGGFRFWHSGTDNRSTTPSYNYYCCQDLEHVAKSFSRNIRNITPRERFPCKGHLKLRPFTTDQCLTLELHHEYHEPYKTMDASSEMVKDNKPPVGDSLSISPNANEPCTSDNDSGGSILVEEHDNVTLKLKSVIEGMKQAIQLAESQIDNKEFAEEFIASHSFIVPLVKKLQMMEEYQRTPPRSVFL